MIKMKLITVEKGDVTCSMKVTGIGPKCIKVTYTEDFGDDDTDTRDIFIQNDRVVTRTDSEIIHKVLDGQTPYYSQYSGVEPEFYEVMQ